MIKTLAIFFALWSFFFSINSLKADNKDIVACEHPCQQACQRDEKWVREGAM